MHTINVPLPSLNKELWDRLEVAPSSPERKAIRLQIPAQAVTVEMQLFKTAKFCMEHGL